MKGNPHLACAQHIPDQSGFCHLSQGARLRLRSFAVAIAVWRPMHAIGRPDILLPCCTACINLLARQMRIFCIRLAQAERMPLGGHGATESSLPHVSLVQAGKLSTERGRIKSSRSSTEKF